MPSLQDMIAGPWRAVPVLGITQIVAWGSIFYSPVLTVPLIVAERGWSLSFGMGGFSIGLLVAGLVSPFVGRSIDRYGGHVVMTAGSLISALGLLCLSFVGDPAAYLAVWVLLGVGLGASLYDPAFATLGRIFGAAARRPITVLTLAGGFASTAGWPTTHFLIGSVGWRGTYLVYAVLLAAICAPLHAFALPRSRAKIEAPATGAGAQPAAVLPPHGIAFVLVTAAFTAYAFVPSALSAHLLAIFGRKGIDPETVVLIGAPVRSRAGHRPRDGAGVRPQRAPAPGGARVGDTAGPGLPLAERVRDFGAGRGRLRAGVRRRQRPHHHRARCAAAGVVRSGWLRPADRPHQRALALDAIGRPAGDGVCGRAHLGRDGACARGRLRAGGAGMLCRDPAACAGALTAVGAVHPALAQRNIASMSSWVEWPGSSGSFGPLR
jgi:MFS family permease